MYTFQQLSDSGSFGYPEGTEVHYASSLQGLRFRLADWAAVHERIGSDSREAVIRVWKGRVPDVTDVYPDFDLRYGPRGGIRRESL